LINYLGFFHNILNMTWIAPSFNYRYSLMHVHTSHQPYGYSPLMLCSWQRTHKTHDVVYDTFVAIAHDAGFHMGQKQLHVLPSNRFNSSCQRVDIVLIGANMITWATLACFLTIFMIIFGEIFLKKSLKIMIIFY
jgi:hypothetical protein